MQRLFSKPMKRRLGETLAYAEEMVIRVQHYRRKPQSLIGVFFGWGVLFLGVETPLKIAMVSQSVSQSVSE